MKFSTPYSDVKKVTVTFEKPSLTDRCQQQDADINYIIERYVRTGIMPPTSPMQYLDCTTVKDYQESMYLVAECNSAFEQLPSKVRDEFKTVENYLSYISNPDNVQDCVNRNLINPDSVPVEIINEIQKSNISGEKFVPENIQTNSPDIVQKPETVTTTEQT